MLDIIYRYDPTSENAPQPPADVAEARQRLECGNVTFAHLLEIDPHAAEPGPRIIHFGLEDLGIGPRGAAPRQEPFAVILGCSDARVPTEMIFNEGCNSLFVVRVAGNVLGSECLGSVDYAVQHLGSRLKLLVVLGHSGCGAVTAAVDAFLNPSRYFAIGSSHPLRAIVDRILVAAQTGAQVLARVWGQDVVRKPGYRSALIETTIPLNAMINASALRHELLEGRESDLRIFFSVYDLATRHVRLPVAGQKVDCDDEVRLVELPESLEAMTELSEQLAGSDYIKGLLAAS